MATRGNDLSEFTKGQINALRIHAEFTKPEIADCLEVSVNTIKKYLQKIQIGPERDKINRKNCGRKKKSTDEEDALIVQIARDNPFASANKIKQELNIDLSRRRISDRILDAGLKSYKPARKTKLTQWHKDERSQWAEQKLFWREREWKKVAFSDESKFCMGHSGIQYVRRPMNCRYEEVYVCSVPNRSVANVMVWGAFSIIGYTDLIRIDGRLNARDYTDLLQNHLLPVRQTILPVDGIFQQDNAPIHSANHTQQFLRENDITTLEWPSLSPDMNPIENVWGLMETKLQREYETPNNDNELYQTLTQIWNDLMEDNSYRRSLINSMSHRIEALHAVGGGFTHY